MPCGALKKVAYGMVVVALYQHWLDAELPKLDGLMTCLEALLDIIGSCGMSFFIVLGVFRDRRFDALWRGSGLRDGSRTPLTGFARCRVAGGFQESMM